MTTNLDEIYKDVLFRSGKDLRGGYITPDNFNLAIKVVNQRFMNQLVDNFENSKEVSKDLQPFIKTLGSPQYQALEFTPVLASDVKKGGYADIPDDMWYEATSSYLSLLNNGCSVESDYRTVEFVSQHEFDAKMRSSITSPVDNPEENDPILVNRNNLYYIYPFVRRISFTYIRTPETPVYGYTTNTGIPVYNPSTSVQFEYPETCVDTLTDMIKTYIAIGIESQWNVQTQMPSKL